jgi:cell fate (sporulation/competence/biofilm development) regulator YlbF (YheA/YmcA/DUF963 family)
MADGAYFVGKSAQTQLLCGAGFPGVAGLAGREPDPPLRRNPLKINRFSRPLPHGENIRLLFRQIHVQWEGCTANCRRRNQTIFMQTTTGQDVITQKTRELCEAIVSQPNFRSSHDRIEAFMADEKARNLYENVVNKGQQLHDKQHRAEPLDQTEIAAFEKDREVLLANPVARGFIDAQEELHDIKHSVQKFISKTLELGRLPSAEDLEEGCGHGGCGCGHGH